MDQYHIFICKSSILWFSCREVYFEAFSIFWGWLKVRSRKSLSQSEELRSSKGTIVLSSLPCNYNKSTLKLSSFTTFAAGSTPSCVWRQLWCSNSQTVLVDLFDLCDKNFEQLNYSKLSYCWISKYILKYKRKRCKLPQENNTREGLAKPCETWELPKRRHQVVLVDLRFKLRAMLVKVITWFREQFGINKHE